MLDRQLAISVPATRWIVVALTLVTATLLRLPGLNRWSLTAEEGATALTGWNLLRGEDVPSDLLGRPLLVEWTALFTFLGHATDSVVRMSAALAGVGLVALLVVLSRWIGTRPALAAALLVAVSPTMIANSRRLDGGMLVALLVMTFIVLAFAGRDRSSPVLPVASGATAALLVLAGPIGIAGLILAVLASFLLLRPATHIHTTALVSGAAGFIGTYLALATVLFTRPRSLLDTTAEIFRLLFVEHVSNIGDRFHVPFVNLLVNEPLLLALAIAGFAITVHRALARAFGIWALASLVLVSMLGDTGIAGHVLVVLPLALLAGLGVEHLLARVPWCLVRTGPAALYIGALILLFLAVLSLIGLVTPAGGLSGWDWIARLVLVVLIVVVPLAVFVSLISNRITGHHLTLILTTVVLVLSVITVRAAVLSASERPGSPTDPLAHGGIASSLPAVISRIERVSIDFTRTERTIQDPTGGHGLNIAVDQSIEQPLAWYFRDFPNFTTFDPDSEQPDVHSQVVFLAGSRNPDVSTPAMTHETYVYRWDAPAFLDSPDWGDLFRSLFSVSDWRHFWGYIVERTDPAPETRVDFHLALAPAVAERLFGPTGPFALDDRAGAGVAGGQFNSPRGIAIDAAGNTYIVDSGNQRIQVFGADGAFQFAFGEPGTGPGQLGQFGSGQGGAGGIAIADDRVYVADTWNHRIQVFDLAGQFIQEWGGFFDAQDNPEANATNAGLFYGPRGIAVHDERVFVTDTGNERVQLFDLEGNILALWGTAGNEPGELLEPVGITIVDDVVYVADSHNSRIAGFSLDGDLVDTWPIMEWNGLRFFEPYLTGTTDGWLLATTSATNEILLVDPASGDVQLLPPGDILRPFGIAVDVDAERALVTDGVRNAVLPLPLN